MDKGALQWLLRERRALIAPEEYGLSRPSRQGRRAPGLTQSQIDQLLHRTHGTYNRLETGNYPNPPEDLLRDVARLLAFNEHEWSLLWLYTLHRDPPTPLHPRSGTEVRGAWQDVIDGISHIAYITDQSWRVVTYNKAFAEIFPNGRVPTNTMRWMLLAPEAREILMGWDEHWLPMVLPQLRAAMAALPNDETLAGIEKDVLADPVAGPLYEAGGGSYIHPDGDERPLLHARLGPGWVSLCSAEPLSSPRARLMVMIFRPGEERRHTGPAILRAT
ncbi:helix-turn-helix domain-containing protein [Streptomyces mobaraensis]|uniref:MmyB family transcriptional regulator n=1 Tax=Streptomyces mobaraensis TaxID=35621 RepID=UPI00332F4028